MQSANVIRRPVLFSALLALGLAGAALAGGIDLRLEAAVKAVDEKTGLVTLEVSLEHRAGCFPTCFIDPEPNGLGPRVVLERRGRDAKGQESWTAVEGAWVFPDLRRRGPRPAEGPFRLDEGTKLSFSRQARLEPGAYRLSVALTLRDGDRSHEVGSYHSAVIEVAAPRN